MSDDFNRPLAAQQIGEAFQCPADWAKIFRVQEPAFFEPLDTLWREMLRDHVRGDESQYVGDDFMFTLFDLSMESDSELRAMQINVNAWKDTCRHQFLTAIRRFTNLRYASRREYAKHLPPLGPPRGADWIDNESRKRGVSLFYFDIPEDEMLTAFLHAMFWTFSGGEDMLGLSAADQIVWDKIMNDENSRIAFDCVDLIGASGGAPTNFVCFELDAAIPIVHGYPVSEHEAQRIHKDGPIHVIDELGAWRRA